MGRATAPDLRAARRRYEAGAWRAVVFRDLVLESIRALRSRFTTITALDVGCGHGFDDSAELQDSLAKHVDRLVGVEPDPAIPAPPCFEVVHRTLLEDAPVEPASVHVAWSAFVLEHVEDAGGFFAKLHEVLVPGGVAWGFTMELRHLFPLASTLLERTGLKDRYLQRLRGARGEERYENYPTWYRANSPRQIARLAEGFADAEVMSMGRVGQLDFYVPAALQPVAHLLDRLQIGLGLPGSLLVVRLRR